MFWEENSEEPAREEDGGADDSSDDGAEEEPVADEEEEDEEDEGDDRAEVFKDMAGPSEVPTEEPMPPIAGPMTLPLWYPPVRCCDCCCG